MLELCPKEVYCFAERQEKVSYGFGYKLTLTRMNDNSVLKEKQMQQTMPKLKITVLNGTCHITHLVCNYRR